ncbi:uncharacterized protein [Symphalangus syndactylus]|uniref:uncharacterized protein n=1 Tax=Symphalangus syndactylus TaxID=9590 RepID=UPI003005FE55
MDYGTGGPPLPHALDHCRTGPPLHRTLEYGTGRPPSRRYSDSTTEDLRPLVPWTKAREDLTSPPHGLSHRKTPTPPPPRARDSDKTGPLPPAPRTTARQEPPSSEVLTMATVDPRPALEDQCLPADSSTGLSQGRIPVPPCPTLWHGRTQPHCALDSSTRGLLHGGLPLHHVLDSCTREPPPRCTLDTARQESRPVALWTAAPEDPHPSAPWTTAPQDSCSAALWTMAPEDPASLRPGLRHQRTQPLASWTMAPEDPVPWRPGLSHSRTPQHRVLLHRRTLAGLRPGLSC